MQHQHSTCIFCKYSQRSGYLFPLLCSHRKIFVSPCDLTEQLDSFCATWKIFFKSQFFYIVSEKKIKALLIMNEENLASFAYLIFLPHRESSACFQDLVYHHHIIQYTQIYCIKRKCEKLHIHKILQNYNYTNFIYIFRLISFSL